MSHEQQPPGIRKSQVRNGPEACDVHFVPRNPLTGHLVRIKRELHANSCLCKTYGSDFICAAALSDTLRCILVLQEMFSALQSVETLLLQVNCFDSKSAQANKKTYVLPSVVLLRLLTSQVEEISPAQCIKELC